MTLDELSAARVAAGARYAAAVAELSDALVDLAALDRAVSNANLNPGGCGDVKTFGHLPVNIGDLAHGEFVPRASGVDWRADVEALAGRYIEECTN